MLTGTRVSVKSRERSPSWSCAIKEASLYSEGDGPLSRQLAAIREEATRLQAERSALEESVIAGDRARAALAGLADILRSARNWGAYDLFGGGMFASAVKHEKLALL